MFADPVVKCDAADPSCIQGKTRKLFWKVQRLSRMHHLADRTIWCRKDFDFISARKLPNIPGNSYIYSFV